MHPLDIFSDSPKYFIFQKETNKTNFGGVLTLFFSLIMIFISVLYLLDYNEMNDYSIEYSHIIKNSMDNFPILDSNPDYNPNFTFYIKLFDYNDQELSDNFILYDSNTKEQLNKSESKYNYTIINRRISDFSIGVFYRCIDEYDCSLREEDKSKYGYYLQIYYFTQKIDLQNSPTPFKNDLVWNIINVDFYYST